MQGVCVDVWRDMYVDLSVSDVDTVCGRGIGCTWVRKPVSALQYFIMDFYTIRSILLQVSWSVRMECPETCRLMRLSTQSTRIRHCLLGKVSQGKNGASFSCSVTTTTPIVQ